jgi:hypothetical protein
VRPNCAAILTLPPISGGITGGGSQPPLKIKAKKMNRNSVAAIIGACLMVPAFVGTAFVGNAVAQPYRYERDRHYYVHDFDRWHGGHWFHGGHGGRDGWWWVIGDSWYYYPAPVYPYPDPYALPMVVVPPAPPPGGPPPVAQAAPPAPPPANAPYCREYHGDAIINGNNQPFYGTACLEQDGAWHIMN